MVEQIQHTVIHSDRYFVSYRESSGGFDTEILVSDGRIISTAGPLLEWRGGWFDVFCVMCDDLGWKIEKIL